MSKERITLAELADQMREMREGLFALRADLSGIMKDAKTLAKRRKNKAERQARWRAGKGKKQAANVDATSVCVDATERKDGEERNLPPTPPIKREEGDKESKASASLPRVCARVRVNRR